MRPQKLTRSAIVLAKSMVLSRCLLAVGVLFLPTFAAEAQTVTPFSYFTTLTAAERASSQIKVTYMGPQLAGLPSPIFHASNEAPNAELFVPFHHPMDGEASYANDSAGGSPVPVAADSIQAMINSVSGISALTDGGTTADPDDAFVALSIVVRLPVWRGFDSVLTRSETVGVVAQLRSALVNEPEALRVHDEFACIVGMSDPMRPVDVTSSVTIQVSGVRPDLATGHFVGTAKVTNSSATSIPAPISLILELPSTLRLVNDSGRTCPGGKPFVTLDTTLGPGAVANFSLVFSNPDLDRMAVAPKLLAGPGTR